MNKPRVYLIQNNIAPYRIKLFETISKNANFDFSVVLTAKKCKHRPHWNFDTEKVPFKIQTMRGVNIALSYEKSFSFSFGLMSKLITDRPDVVICGGFNSATLITYFYKRFFGGKYIVWSESTEITERRICKAKLVLRRLLARNADAFIDAGTLSRQYLESLIPEGLGRPFFRAFNCVDGLAFSSNSEDYRQDNLASSTISSHNILFVGRLNENKGIPMLLEVYQEVVNNCEKEPGLFLVGEGPLMARAQKYKYERGLSKIYIEGRVSYDRVVRYYRTCDVFVLLSLSDCNPLVVLEALHCGIPIICTNRAGNAPDFIVPGENGYIVDPTDKDAIVQDVMTVLSWDAQKRDSAAQLSKELVKKANYDDSAEAFVRACNHVHTTR
jgi:glycosyltransferase involved in cell wall biosynthesis